MDLKSFSPFVSTILKAQGALVEDTPGLSNAISQSAKQGLPRISIGPTQGRFLTQLCQLANARRILEVGTLGGYSTIWLATSVPGVKVTSIEFNKHHAKVARDNVAAAGIKEGDVEIRLGPALEVLPKVAAEIKSDADKFDFVFIDADWDEQAEYFDWAVKMTRKGGIVFVDNAVRQLHEDSPKAFALIDAVKNDDRVSPVLMPTFISEIKGVHPEAIDGFLMALVK